MNRGGKPVGESIAEASASTPANDNHQRIADGGIVVTLPADDGRVAIETVINCSPERIHQLLTDYSRLPQHIASLERAEVLSPGQTSNTVRFSMKLPFPIGRITWINRIQVWHLNGTWCIAWALESGDLRENAGQLLFSRYQGERGRSHVRYSVQVETRAPLPKAAERLATRWLLPRVVGRLRSTLEVPRV